MTEVASALKRRDQFVLETALPAYMLCMIYEEVQRAGWLLRFDVLGHLGRAAVAPLAKLDELSVSRIARQMTDIGEALLREVNPSDPRYGLYSVAQFVMMLIDQGLFRDATNQAVLVSLLLVDDVKDDRPDVAGALPVWRVEEMKWQAEAKKMLHRAQLMGLYVKDNFQIAV